MTKNELLKELSQNHNIPVATLKDVVNDTFALIAQSIYNDGEFSQRGFGKFSVANYSKRSILHIQTGEKTEIPERKCVKFVPSRKLNKSISKP